MKQEPRPAIHMAKPLLIADPSGDLQGGANSISQVDGVFDIAPAFQLCASAWGGFRKGTMASAHLSVRKNAVPQLSPWCQTLQFLPVCHWCLSSFYPDAGVQRK